MLVWELSNPLHPLMQGFMLYISLIIAVGPQNLFLLQQGLRRKHLFTAASLSTLADLVMIGISVGGMGAVITANPFLLTFATLGGAAFLCGYAICSLRSLWRCPSAASRTLTSTRAAGRRGVIAATLSFSLLNPGTYVDTLLMIGATGSQYAFDDRFIFGAGAVLASALWFFTLTYGSSRLAPLFKHSLAWRTLDIISGCMMLVVAITLYYQR